MENAFKGVLGIYKNGNYLVTILKDGTKIRQTEADEFIPDHPETFDCKITDCCDGACQFCFPEGTSIQTSMGLKNIENIQIDDKVYSMNKSGDIQIKNVDQIFKRKYKGDLIKISDGKNTITCTPNHEIFTKNRGWVRADELMESDELLTFKH